MSNSLKPRLILHIMVVLVFLTVAAAAEDAASQIKREATRLEQSLKDRPLTDPDLAEINTIVAASLKNVSAALNAGHVYLALEDLAEAFDLVHGGRAAADKATVLKGGLPAYDAEWNDARLKLTALDQEATKRNWSHAPAALQALSEAAQGKSLPLLEGGRGFATATEPKDGLLYLGEAQGEAQFAQFCASLTLPRKSASFPLRSLSAELQILQDKTNAAFQPPKSIELHSRFIGLNSSIKLAQELNARKFYAGALYQYLDGVRRYGMLDAPPLDAAKQSALNDSLGAAQKKLAASVRDDSIAQLFVERAASQIAHADGSAPSADEWRSAQVIVDQVLPAYFAAEKPVSSTPKAPENLVTITLVRWPYT
ncbi:MAG TPA: hypothetical protein VGI45_11350 [Terracidiphilus sp.]|jgi:hypothetical protein